MNNTARCWSGTFMVLLEQFPCKCLPMWMCCIGVVNLSKALTRIPMALLTSSIAHLATFAQQRLTYIHVGISEIIYSPTAFRSQNIINSFIGERLSFATM